MYIHIDSAVVMKFSGIVIFVKQEVEATVCERGEVWVNILIICQCVVWERWIPFVGVEEREVGCKCEAQDLELPKLLLAHVHVRVCYV